MEGYIRVNQTFYNKFIRASRRQVYHVTEIVESVEVPNVFGCIVVIGTRIDCALDHFMFDLKVE